MHGVARSLGDFSYKEDGNSAVEDQIVTCQPDLVCHERNDSEDEFVLICCDGVWDVMKSQDAISFIHDTLAEPDVKTLEEVVEKLLDTCLAKGSNDNMTAAIIAFPEWAKKHR